jgi:hypothetical protein
MPLFAAPRTVSSARVRLARSLALVADFLQIIAFPFFGGGVLSPAADALDLCVAVLMVWLLGWHWAFVPTLLIEAAPVFDLFPTWSAAVFYVTRGQAREEDEPLPATPPPLKDITPQKAPDKGREPDPT